MLQNIYVKNLALIDEIEIDLKKGLNILTGETGAGKSIILGSIHLALGGRYSSELLRNEDEAAYVELTFFVENTNLLQQLSAFDISAEDGVVVLSRKMIGKRSVCKINGETVSAATLKEVAAVLIDIHGQHEHQSLLYKKNHLEILDSFAKQDIQELKLQISEWYQIYRRQKEELNEAQLDEKQRIKELGFLEFEIQEIEQANLKPEEDQVLEEEYRRMLNSKKIAGSLEEAYRYTAGSGTNASDLLSRGIRSLQEAANYDDQARSLYEQLAEVDSLLNDFNRELSNYCAASEFSEEDFYEVESRLNEINRLKAKYGNTMEEIDTYLEEKKERLSQLQDYDQYIERLQNSLKETEGHLRKCSEELSGLRKEAAIGLTECIKNELQDLNFLNVQFEIHFESLQDYTANGLDEVEFMISMNPGEPVRSLGEVASGGELSRIMLAIKTVLAEKDQIETLIFDEIDVGISGRTAQKVSEKMAVIGRNHQVICITHLAQIAAMADAHFCIEKNVSGGKTQTSISLLNEKEEITELARILGGAEITETVLRSAAEMKELAKRTK